MSLVKIVRRLVYEWTRYPSELGPASLPDQCSTAYCELPPQYRKSSALITSMQARGTEWAGLEEVYRHPFT